MKQKKISVLVPCYNEEENVEPLCAAIREQLLSLPAYDYEIVFIDNFSADSTREKLTALCAGDPKVKAIFNARNFGQFNSPFYGYLQTSGDCVISMCADFQDPPEMIPKLVAEWEKGAKIVCAIKTTSKENHFIRALRTIYYKLIKKMSEVEQIEHFTGSGLYDRQFIEVLRNLDDPTPFLRGIVAELGFKRKELSFTTYTKTPVRFMTFFGIFLAALGFLGGIAVGVTAGVGVLEEFMPFVLLCVTVFLFGMGFFFLGMLGEYLLTVKAKVTHRPLVVEEKRINFDK